MKKHTQIIIVTLFLVACGAYAQDGMKQLLLNKDLKVEKLVIKNEDITYSLGVINLSEDTWMEYDRDGKEIGKAKIEEFTDDKIRIKWIFAQNGADVGDVTTYNYRKEDDRMIFDVIFDNKEQGFFEAML